MTDTQTEAAKVADELLSHFRSASLEIDSIGQPLFLKDSTAVIQRLLDERDREGIYLKDPKGLCDEAAQYRYEDTKYVQNLEAELKKLKLDVLNLKPRLTNIERLPNCRKSLGYGHD